MHYASSIKLVLAIGLIIIPLTTHGFIDAIAQYYRQAQQAFAGHYKDCTPKDYALLATAGVCAITACSLWNKNRYLKKEYNWYSRALSDHKKNMRIKNFLIALIPISHPCVMIRIRSLALS